MELRHGGAILARQLAVNGVERVFCVPGESYLAALDGLYDTGTIETVVCRHEGGAAMMAEADGKLTGRPGVAFVTRGPGATNAAAGVHVARQDSTPMVLMVGLPPTDFMGRECFQEFDLTAVFGALAKAAFVITGPERIPEFVSRAFHLAMAGRPGPVVVGLPEDLLSASAPVPDAAPVMIAEAAPGAQDMALLATALASSKRPLVLVGGPGWSETTRRRLERTASARDLPVATSFRCQDYVDNRHPSYVGHVGIAPDPALADRVRTADLLLVIGARLGEMTTGGYSLLDVPNPSTKLVHVHPDPAELGSVYRADLAIASTAERFVAAFEALDPGAKTETAPAWPSWRAEARADYECFIEPQASTGPVRLEQIITLLSETLPDDAIVTNGAGNYAGWLHRYYQWRSWRTQLAPTSGSMGYGVPAAVAAKMRHPDRPVVALAGDGCFMMTAQELATAAQYDAPIIVIIVDNAMYGTIRMHQEKSYPARVMATTLVNPDFAALARSFGAEGALVARTCDFAPALQKALGCETSSVIVLRIDDEAITPTTTLAAIRQKALDADGTR